MKAAMLLSAVLISPLTAQTFGNNYHIGFERPESWGLKYYTSATLLSGLQPAEPAEGHHAGSISIAFEMGWVPSLDEGQRRIGFNGKAVQDLNQTPFFGRPVIRVGLPWKLTAIAAAPPPFHLLGTTAHLLAF